LKECLKNRRGNIVVISVLVVFTFLSAYILFHFSQKTLAKDMLKNMWLIGKDIEDPQIVSEHIKQQNTKVFKLISIDGYYIGKGFIKGNLYYIFQVLEEKSDKGYETAPINASEFVYDGKNIVEVTETDVEQKHKSRISGKIDNWNITEYHYVFHVPPENKIKDYGVIEEVLPTYTVYPLHTYTVYPSRRIVVP